MLLLKGLQLCGNAKKKKKKNQHKKMSLNTRKPSKNNMHFFRFDSGFQPLLQKAKGFANI